MPSPPRARLTLLAAAAAAALACGGDPTPDPLPVTRVDSAGVEIVTTRIDAAVPTCALQGEPVRIGSVDGDAATSLFAIEDAVRLSDGRVAVSLDGGAPAIAIFDAAGSPMARWGRRGEGPGEFKDTWRIWSHEDTVIVLDLRPVKFHYFDPQGVWLRTVPLDPVVFERPDFIFPLPGGQGFVSETQRTRPSSPPDPYDDVPTVVRFGSDGALADTLGVFWKQHLMWTDPVNRYLDRPVFGAFARMAPVLANGIAYATGVESQIEILDLEGSALRIIRWDARDRTVRPDDVEAFKVNLRRLFEAGEGPSPQVEAAIRRETGDHRPVAEQFPGHGRILATPGGRLWIEDYRRPLDEGPSPWFVFESEGTFVCRVSVPEGWTTLSVGADHVVATYRDDLDVEYVVVQPVAPPRTGP